MALARMCFGLLGLIDRRAESRGLITAEAVVKTVMDSELTVLGGIFATLAVEGLR